MSKPDARSPDLDLDERVRIAVYEAAAAATEIPDARAVAGRFGIDHAAARASLARLADARVLVLAPGGERIHWAPPFANAQANFTVEASGRRYRSACAWEALGVPVFLGSDARIATRCPDCGERLEVAVEGGRARGGDDVRVHIPVPARRWWDDVLDTCGTIRMIASDEHLERWRAETGLARGAVLTLAQADALARVWTTDRRAPGWRRPTKDEAQAMFARLGLEGEAWALG